MSLPFGELPVHTPAVCSRPIDLGDWSQVAPLFDQLDARACNAPPVEQFEQWILDTGELAAALDEESSRRYIAMTCHTDSPEAEKSHLEFHGARGTGAETSPLCRGEGLSGASAPQVAARPRYEVFDRDTALLVELVPG